jgi:hypothetical protein
MGGLEGVLAGFIFGEMASIVVSLILLNRILRAPPLAGFDRLGLFLPVAAIIVAWNVFSPSGSPLILFLLGVGTVTLAAVILRRERGTLREVMAMLGPLMRKLQREPKSVSSS